MVDVSTHIVINRPPDVVGSYAADPASAAEWYDNIDSAKWVSEPPLRRGSQIEFRARFLGRELVYTYEVIEYDPNGRLTMRTSEGPFPMETTYLWKANGPESTAMTLRNSGMPTGFSRMSAPVMAMAMRRANRKDLEKLKAILES